MQILDLPFYVKEKHKKGKKYFFYTYMKWPKNLHFLHLDQKPHPVNFGGWGWGAVASLRLRAGGTARGLTRTSRNGYD